MTLYEISNKTTINFVKLFPVILTFYLAFGMTGEAYNLIDYAEYTSHTTVICHNYIVDIGFLFLSFSFKFCWWHRILIISDILVLVSIDLYKNDIFIPNIFHTLSGFLLLSLIFATILYYKNGCFSKKKNSNCFRGIDSSNRQR